MKYIYLVRGCSHYKLAYTLSAHPTQQSADISAASLMAANALEERSCPYDYYDTQTLPVKELKENP